MSDLWSKAFRGMRLPSGETTEDTREYAARWDELGSFLERMFSGYKVTCCNPGFLLTHPEVKSGPLEISAHAAQALLSAVEALPQKKRKKGSKSK